MFTGVVGVAQETTAYRYQINLKEIQKKRFQVVLNCSDFAQDTLIYHFPWIIPGTYKEANYGKYIHKLKAVDAQGKRIKVKKAGKNTFIITPANKISRMEYWVSATWDGWGGIWPMAGTGIIEDRVFAINAGGVFGYFQGEELHPIVMKYHYPENLYAMTVLDQQSPNTDLVEITAKDYHELIDSPILFAYPDTATFGIHDSQVLVAYAHESDDTRRAQSLLNVLQPSMTAIGSYLDTLPADNYAYLIYYSDAEELGEIILNQRFRILKAVWYVLFNGLPVGGALEHNKSSFYYLPDPAHGMSDYLAETIKSISIHEFMHIITPLNLRSQYIHNWDYADPRLSRHLWLYEGVTEYLSEIIQANGRLKTPKEFLLETMRAKIRRGERYPFEQTSFTEMSENVLTKENQKIYTQVYQRGAVIAMLLDIEIMRLSKGRQRLIDVLLDLVRDFGQGKPMDEDTIIDEFVNRVHPDLRQFFANYVEGHEPLPYKRVLAEIGVVYEADTTLSMPFNPLVDAGVKETRFSLSGKLTIAKPDKVNRLGLKKGDQVERNFYQDLYFDDLGNPWPEGSLVHLPVHREGSQIVLVDTVHFIEKDEQHYMRIQNAMEPDQAHLFNIWMGYEDPGTPVSALSQEELDTQYND